jgi:hypothetical protein
MRSDGLWWFWVLEKSRATSFLFNTQGAFCLNQTGSNSVPACNAKRSFGGQAFVHPGIVLFELQQKIAF